MECKDIEKEKCKMVFPSEIIEKIGNYLSINSLMSMRLTCKWFNSSLNRLYTKKLNNLEWKITTHILFSAGYKDFMISKICISIGYFYSKNYIYHHEKCDECENYSFLYDEMCSHNYVERDQIYTSMEKGKGGDILKNIINIYKNNKNNINTIPVSVLNSIEHNFDIKTIIGYTDTGKNYDAKLFLGDMDHISSDDAIYTKYNLHGQLYKVEKPEDIYFYPRIFINND